MTEEIKRLESIQERFQPYIDNPNLVYTFIAPKDKSLFERFFKMATNLPGSSLYEVLSDRNQVSELLLNNFPQDTVLEIYTGTNDEVTSIFAKGTLKDYIKQKQISFDY
ncbi:MAG: hypothetical protein EO766_17580 [Hydrotalea sp. AMD]|uniref:hypothetical protein n=1 Tax=Hydrotalea sp. AMD TaxID=2501297 RepID=UPI000942B02C|nr:hypothetical protein [Hydrotalea sp. AMD]RWZ83846.1 MAG: hypothetical protein EO766_17580 [Hydrotalea sp. AMD]